MSIDILVMLGVCVSLFVVYKVIDRLLRWPRVGRHSDRYILVTGCSSGFGFETVKRLDGLGCHVFAGCRREESVEKLKKIFSDRVQPIRMDVSDPNSVRDAFRYVSAKLPKGTGLWGLVNNAGIGHILPTWLATVDMYRRVIAINLYGVIDVTMTFLSLVKLARGRIVNVSSSSGRIALPVTVPYAVSKYGLEAFTDGLRRSLLPFGCQALLVEPGAFRTNILSVDPHLEEFDNAWNAKFKARCDVNEAPMLAEHEYETMRQKERDKLRKMISEYPISDRVDLVIDALEHAMLGRYPRARYLVGAQAKLFVMLQEMPEWFSDWILSFALPKFDMCIK